MSDPGDIPRFGRANLVRALSEARTLPEDALRRAARQPDRIAGPVIEAVSAAAAGVPPSPEDENLIFWGIHALAQARETRLCQPLLRLLRLPDEEIETILGDAVTATLPRLVASVFDGDAAALEAIVADRDVDEYVRWSVLQALVFLTVRGRVDRDGTAAFLRRFEAERPARAGEAVWNGLEEAVALLGLADLAPAVEAAFAEGRILDDFHDPQWFRDTLAAAIADPDDDSNLDPLAFGTIDDAVAELEGLFAMAEAAGEFEPAEPVVNPLRDVGRNDPCPCGSGLKYKKCCLVA